MYLLVAFPLIEKNFFTEPIILENAQKTTYCIVFVSTVNLLTLYLLFFFE